MWSLWILVTFLCAATSEGTANEMLQSSDGLFEQGRYREAEAGYRRAIQADPTLYRAHLGLAMVLHRGGRRDEAIEACKAAIGTRQDGLEAYYLLADFLLEAQRNEEAASNYEQLRKLNPHDAEIHHGLGTALSRLGRWTEAVGALREAIRLNPSYVSAHYSLGLALGALGQHEALRLDASYPKIHYSRGVILERLGNTRGAEEAYRRGIKQQSSDADGYRALGRLLVATGRYDDAVSVAQGLVQLEPESASSHLNHGYALSLAGRHSLALNAFDRALTMDPKALNASPTLEQAYKRSLRAAGSDGR
jgi:tetratricopeptide (TPR) repeat protein